MLNLPELCANIDIRYDNDKIVRAITILLNRYSYEFTDNQRDSISKILTENQPL